MEGWKRKEFSEQHKCDLAKKRISKEKEYCSVVGVEGEPSR